MLLVGSVMLVLDHFIVNVALPPIESGLHASGAELEWVVAGYGLTFAALLVTAGRLGDRFGRRRVFIRGLDGFGAASVLCRLARRLALSAAELAGLLIVVAALTRLLPSPKAAD